MLTERLSGGFPPATHAGLDRRLRAASRRNVRRVCIGKRKVVQALFLRAACRSANTAPSNQPIVLRDAYADWPARVSSSATAAFPFPRPSRVRRSGLYSAMRLDAGSARNHPCACALSSASKGTGTSPAQLVGSQENRGRSCARPHQQQRLAPAGPGRSSPHAPSKVAPTRRCRCLLGHLA